MVQASIFVRPVQLTDLTHISDAAKVINSAYNASDCWAPGANIINEPRCSEDEVKYLIETSGKQTTLLFAFEGNHVVGTLLIRTTHDSPKEAELTLFSVSPLHQSRGIGGKLIRQAMTEMIDLGYQTVSLVVLDNRLELISWYKKFGFEEYDRYPFVWPSPTKVKDLHLLALRKKLY